MNIIIDIRPLLTTPRTGVGEYTFELLDHLFKIDKTNQYFLYYNSFKNIDHLIPNWQQNNVRIIKTVYPNKLFNLSLIIFKYPKLDKLVKKKTGIKPDIFFSPNLNFLALSKGIKKILTVHDLSYTLYSEFYSFHQRLWHKIISPKKQCQEADVIFTPSNNTKQDLIKYYKINQEKIKVTPLGLSTNFINPIFTNIRQKYNLTHDYLLFLGTIEPRKNVLGIIKAFEKSQNIFFGDLVLAGAQGFQYKKILDYIKKSPVKDRIKIIDYVDKSDKPALYKNAKIFLFPSFYEGFGLPVLEAMSVSTPVITSNRSSLSEITNNTAWLVNPYRINEISEAIKKILTDEKLRNRMKEEGIKQADGFRWEKVVELLHPHTSSK
jgi:glycosyltransferase involved in cell wall biosynthesis